ncbi:MAG: ribosome maturation factor RimM [Muribaculaceae bacterium]|nr:ribosome maturation factor RimM [Muribaculaceae bacterium]
MIEDKEIKEVGKFQKTHALKGELNAILEIDSEFFSEGNALIVDIDGIYVPFFTTSVRPKGATSFLIKLEGVETEEEAKAFVNKIIYVQKNELAPFMGIEEDDIPDEENFSGYDIIDTHTGQIIGKVENVDSSTENLLFIVKNGNGEIIYIPAVDDFIDEIDDENKIILMTLPSGLIELNQKQ